MKPFVFVFLIICPFLIHGQSQALIKIRNLSRENSFETSFKIDSILGSTHESASLVMGYRAIADMIRAKSSLFPIDKLKYFKEGRRKLELSIQTDYYSVELRYLRFCIQTNVPFYLNYSNNIEEDKRHILNHWNQLTDSDLKQRIKVYMMRSDFCNEIEKRHFSNG